MKAAIDGNVDVAVGFMSLQLIRTKFLSETSSYASIPLAIVVPHGEEYSGIEKLIRPFHSEVWWIICLVNMIGILSIFVIFYFPIKVYNFIVGRNVKNPMYNLFAVIYGIPQHVLPGRNFARYILMCFMLYCLTLRSVYQGRVYQMIKSDERKPELSSIQEMIDRKFHFYLYETLAGRVQDFRFYPLRIVYPNEQQRMYRMKTLNPSFKGVMFNYLDQIMYVNQKSYRNHTFIVCKELFITNQFVFYFRKNHYLVEDINAKLHLMLANGMIQHITAKYVDPKFLKIVQNTNERKVLTVDHFAGAFKLLAIFSLMATMMFVLEILTKIKKLSLLKKTSDYVQLKLSK